MIIDTLNHLSDYVALNPLLKKVVEFLECHDLSAMDEGKYPIVADDLYLNLTTAKGKTPDEAVMETHRMMADIQIPLSGPETYGYAPLCALPEAEYNEEKDICKMPGVKAQCCVTCQPGMFAIFFPQDGHAPCIAQEPTIRKAIFKMRVAEK